MNKKLLALAIGAAVAMPVVALAEGPTLYGNLNVSLNVKRAAGVAPAPDADTWTVDDNASRIGVKGSAETGVDGMKGIYVAEFGVVVDGSAATPFKNRNMYAGVDGNFGKLVMGMMDTPLKSAQGKVDQFNDTSVADITAYTTGELRAANMVTYATPKLGDAVTVTVALIQAEAATVGLGEDGISASVVYDQDGMFAAVAMDKEVVPGGAGVVAGGAGVNDITRLALGYTSDDFEVGFLYQMSEKTLVVGTAEDTTMVLSGALKTGAMKYKLQYGQTEGDTGVPTTNTETMITLGADYAAGKATTLYSYIAMNEDDVALDDTHLAFGIKQAF